jgi:multidrug efflux pump subunit AcrA (membrane-fusion protein)
MTDMKFRVSTLTILTVVAALLVTLGGAGQPAHGAPATGMLSVWQVAEGNQRFTVSGTVESVSYASNTVRISANGQTVGVLVTPTTVIEIHGEAGSMADIRRGSKISASGVVRDGQKVALSIVLK